MKLTIATSILLTQITPTAPLSIHPRRPNRTPIKRSLSSTTYAPPVEINTIPNEEGLLDVEYITNSLLEPPIRGLDGSGSEYDDWSVDNGYEDVQKMQPPPQQQQFQYRQHIQQPNLNNEVLTGAQRRQSWESYAAPNTPGRAIDSTSGGVIGSPRGIGDWEYSTSYGPATSVIGATVGNFDAPRNNVASGVRGSATVNRFHQGTTIGNFGYQTRPANNRQLYQNGPDYYQNHGTVMTGAQRRERFHSFHSYEPGYVEYGPPIGGVIYNDFAPQEIAVNNQANAVDDRRENVGFKPLLPATQMPNVMPVQRSMNNQANAINGSGMEEKTHFNRSMPVVPAPKANVMPTQASINNQAKAINGAGPNQKTAMSGFNKPLVAAPKMSNVVPRGAVNNQASAINGASVDQKSNFDGFKPLIPSPKMANIMPAQETVNNQASAINGGVQQKPSLDGFKPSGVLKGPGLKGIESGPAFSKSSVAAPLKGAGPSAPVNGLKGGLSSTMKGPGLNGFAPSNVAPKTALGAAAFSKTGGTPSFNGSPGTSELISGMPAGLGGGMMKGSGGVGLKVKESNKGGFGIGMKSGFKTGPHASATTSGSASPFKSSIPAGLGGGVLNGPGSLGLKGSEPSNGVAATRGPGAGVFGKMSTPPSFKGAAESSSQVNGFSAGSAPNQFKPFVPSHTVQVNEEEPNNLEDKPPSFEDFVRGQKSSVSNYGGPAFPSGQAQIAKQGNAAAPRTDFGNVTFKSSSPVNGFPEGLGKYASTPKGISAGMKFGAGASPGGAFGTSTPLKGAVEASPLVSSMPGGLGAGIMKGLGALGLKGKESSKEGSGFSFGNKSPPSPGAATFSKASSPPINNGAVGAAPPINGAGFGYGTMKGLGLKSKGGGGPASPINGLFGVGSPPALENNVESGEMPNKFKPFVPSHNVQVTEEEPINVEDKPPSFEDFVRGQGNSVANNGAKQGNAATPRPGSAGNFGSTVSFNGFKQKTAPASENLIGRQAVTSPPGPASSFEGTATPNKFKAFVPHTREVPMDAQEDDMEPSKQDFASFLQNPRNMKGKDAKTVAASLSTLSSTPTFYSDFDSNQVAEVPAAAETYNDLNFAITDGTVQTMPSTSDVPMDTPARQSLPPYLSLHAIPGKGLGVITNKAIKIGEFIGNYEGEIFPEDVKDRRYLKSLQHTLTDEDRAWLQSRLDRGQTVTGTYLYGVDLDAGNVYKHFGRNKGENVEEETPERIFVDAEDEYKSLWTRFINHASPPLDNLKPMSVPESYDGNPRVWFMAKRDIEPGEELCFDYGEDYWLEGDEVF